MALDGDVRPYLASLMVSALHKAGDQLVVPQGMEIKAITKEEFENMLREEAGKSYDNYGMIGQDLFGQGVVAKKQTAAEFDRLQR